MSMMQIDEEILTKMRVELETLRQRIGDAVGMLEDGGDTGTPTRQAVIKLLRGDNANPK